jgi:hypothetical protein
MCRTDAARDYKSALGPYQRLLNDGSVRNKTKGHTSGWIGGSFESKVVAFADYFGDREP